MRSSDGDVARSSSKAANSERKMGLADEGGRYMVSRMKDRDLLSEIMVRRTQRDSNEEESGRGILRTLRVDR